MKRQLVGLIVLLTFFAGLITIICVNSKYIFRTEPYYSKTEVEQMCKDAYQQSIKDNSDTALYNKMSELTIKNLELTNKNETLIAENETLNSEITEKGKTIADNEETIENLNLRISKLEENKSANEILIAELRTQVYDLDKQNKLLAYEISENEILIAENNKTIMQLQNSIAYYEEYIQELENEDEVFAIFVVENEIFNIQKLNKNGLAYLETEPTFAGNVTFNGWAVNNEIINLTTYTLSCNTTFVADLTYTYNVNFIVDDEVYNSQTIVENNFATIPEVPTKDGYVFEGWSLNNVDIIENIEKQPIIKNSTYYAVFTKLYTVNFMIDNILSSSQQIRVGSCVESVDVDDTKYLINFWTLNDEVIDIYDYQIFEDTTFIADFTRKYAVNFMVDNTIYSTQYILENDKPIPFSNPVKDDLIFIGWTQDSSISSVFVNTVVTQDITFTAVFDTLIEKQDILSDSEVVGQFYLCNSCYFISMNNGYMLKNFRFHLSWEDSGLDGVYYIKDTSMKYYSEKIGFSFTNTGSDSSLIRFLDKSLNHINSSGQLVYGSTFDYGSPDIVLESISDFSVTKVEQMSFYTYFYSALNENYSDFLTTIPEISLCQSNSVLLNCSSVLEPITLVIPENILIPDGYYLEFYIDNYYLSGSNYTDLSYIGSTLESFSYNISLCPIGYFIVIRYVPINFRFECICITEAQKYLNSRMSVYFPEWQSRWYEQHGHLDLDIYLDTQRPMLIDVNIRELAHCLLKLSS